jgi:hypothetical protein
MKDNHAHIVLIIDKSGSMWNIANDVIGGVNSFIKEQREVEGTADLTLAYFSDPKAYTLVYDSVNIEKADDIDSNTYVTIGSTAMLDGIGRTISTVGKRLNDMDESDRPSKVIVAIMTDGYENSSVEYTLDQIKDMIKTQTDDYNWEFIFMGANIDTVSVGSSMGLTANSCVNYTASSVGTTSAYSSMSASVRSIRGRK